MVIKDIYNKKYFIILSVVILILAFIVVWFLIENKFSFAGNIISLTGDIITGNVVAEPNSIQCYTESKYNFFFKKYKKSDYCEENDENTPPRDYCFNDKSVRPNKKVCVECINNKACASGKCNDKKKCETLSHTPAPNPTPAPACPPGCLTCNSQGLCVYANSSTCYPACKDNEGCNEDAYPPRCEAAECGIAGKQCYGGLICKNKLCVRCENDRDCPAGQSCVQDPNPQVPAGFKVCVNIQTPTDTNTQTNPNKCNIDYDCKNGQICENSKCIEGECTRTKLCKNGEMCEGGRCNKPCSLYRDCSVNEICYNKWKCVPVSCTKNSECPGMLCEKNKCADFECFDDGQCPNFPSQVCVEAKCINTIKCDTNNPCPNGLSCTGGICDDGDGNCNSFEEIDSVLANLEQNNPTKIHADDYEQWVQENFDSIIDFMDAGQCIYGSGVITSVNSGISAIKNIKRTTDSNHPAPTSIIPFDKNGFKKAGHAIIVLNVKDISRFGVPKYEVIYLDSNGPGIFKMQCQIGKFSIGKRRISLFYCKIPDNAPTYQGENVGIGTSILTEVSSDLQVVFTSYCRMNSQSNFCKERVDVAGWIEDGNYPTLQNRGTPNNLGICTGWAEFALRVAYLGEFVGCGN
ncbi:hypothetical protein AUJ62_03260 [Candidatus Pacearchaeota archaeon CG1_02_32_21]|nr:MAG: hypothetical protein AUJ62_03260 [Candidatus Pacearchaeota archaeon CG1_02_32_21]